MTSIMKALVDYDASSDDDETVENDDRMDFDMTAEQSKQCLSEDIQHLKPSMPAASRSIPCNCTMDRQGSPVTKKSRLERSQTKLQVPGTIQSMYGRQAWEDRPEEHENRVRSFPHIEGNWATHVYMPVPFDPRMFEFINECVQLLLPLQFHPMPELHMSLSRTVTIRHHWIDSLVDSLRENLSCFSSCLSDFSSVVLLPNDEKTRTFLCFELTTEDTQFEEYVAAVDKSLAEFKLPLYYKNPSFHVSVAWCLGDVSTQVSEDKKNKLKEMFGDFMASNPDLSVFSAQNVCCRTGNKSFVLPLKEECR